MIISIKQDNLTVAAKLEEDVFEKSVSCEELMLAAFDLIGQVFSQKSVVKAYYRLDPDTMAFRSNEDPIMQMIPQCLKE
ncbi:MAG: hypothetical protein IJU27_04600 [Bacteroidales bacterium]|nr:hypothetical protein [Bacteroidales bacterium]